MRFLGLSISRAKPVEKLQQVDQRGGWWRWIGESFPGAWQQNVTIEVPNVTTNPTVYSCITRIASDIAKLRLRLVRLTADGIWVEVENPSFSPVLRKPNSYQTRIEFFQFWLASKLAFGNTYVLKERDARNVVIGLHILDPRRVRVLVSELGDVFYEISRDDLAGQHVETVTIPASEIIHDKMNTLFHPLVGLSPIYAAGLAAVQGLRIQDNSAAFFGNGARPSGVLVAPGEISQENAEELRAYWQTQFSGGNAGKIAVLGDGLKYEPMMMSSVDAQLIEQLKWTAEVICGCFGVPAYLVGVGAAPLNNNAQTLREIYYSQCLQIHIEQIEILLDEGLGLAPATNGSHPLGTEFDLDDLLRMDQAAQVTAFKDAVGAGVMAPNEARRKIGLGPVKGGETPYLQQQNFSLEALARRDEGNPFASPPPQVQDAPEPADDTERAIAAVRMKFAGALYAA